MAGNVRVVLKSVWDDKALRKAQSDVAQMGKQLGAAAGVATAAFAAAGIALTRFGIDAAKGAEQAAVAQRRLDNIAKSMNVFGNSAGRVSKRLGEFAEANELIVGVDADVIKATQAKLLTFKELAATADTVGGAMDRATMAALDLASAGFGSAESNAVQLGKALNDPIKGITALRRAGITFTEAEQDKIKALVEGNRLLEAQDLILSAIETQVGGTAAATASAFERITLATNQVKDAIGEALLPVVEDFADELALLVPELQSALGPAAEQVATILAESLLPAIQAFGEYLKTPEGIQAVKDLTTEFVNIVTEIVEFTGEVWKNRDAIVEAATAIGIIVIGYGALKIALGLATAAQLIFNTAVKANPYVIAATAIAALVGGLIALDTALLGAGDTQRKADEAAKGFTGRIAELVAEEKRLQVLLGKGAIGFAQYKEMVDKVRGELATLQGQMMRAAGAGRALNDVTLAKFRGQLGDTRIEADKLVEAQRELAYYLAGGKAGTYKPRGVTGGGGGGGGGTKADPAVEAKKRFDAVQKVIQDHQKKLAAAERAYNAEVFKLNEDSAKAQKALREKEAKDLEAIVKQSKRRLTDAFASATQTALTSLFNSRTVKELTQSVRRVSAALTITTTQETEKIISGSVGDVIEGLRTKILGARTLIQNASKLAGLGFSQTFIEQVVEGGTETGNQLAKAILEASPETQAELRRLFLELEDVSSNGMQSVADRIYDEQKLATAELTKLYTDTQAAASLALEEEQKRLASALVGAGLAFNLAVLDIKDEFLSAIGEFDGAFAGLGSTIEAFLKKLDVKAAGAVTDVRAAMTGPGGVLENAKVTESVAFKDLAPLKAVSGLVIDSVNDIAGAISYLQERISAGNRYITNVGAGTQLGIDARGRVTGFEQELAALRGRAAAGSAAGTTININVKTDSTQSQAMVGRTIGNIVTKYVTTGGQVLVSGNA
jgi:hypothetical protein